MKLIFATNNRHKAEELQAVLPDYIQVQTMAEAGYDIAIPEPHDTLEENAQEKATTIFHLSNTPCFSEDTGLEVMALNGEPGVHSARYAGEQKSAAQNTEKLLQELTGIPDRRARFRTVICLILEGNVEFFEGICNGQIAELPKGEGGFGYDSVFVPDEGSGKTCAQMTLPEKNGYSHRRKAVDKLVSFLNGTQDKSE